jgi:hypothetical protein
MNYLNYLSVVEFWLHYQKMREDPYFDLVLQNIILVPNELHLQQHGLQALFKDTWHLKHVWCPLFLSILPYAKNRWEAVLKALGSECASADAALAAAMATGDEVEDDSELPESDPAVPTTAAAMATGDEVEDDSELLESGPAIPATVAALQKQRDEAHAVLAATALHLGSLLPFDNPADATLAEAEGNMLPGQGVSEAALRQENIVVGDDDDDDYDDHVNDEDDGEGSPWVQCDSVRCGFWYLVKNQRGCDGFSMDEIAVMRYFCDRCRARSDFDHDLACEEADAEEAKTEEADEDAPLADTAAQIDELMGGGVENIPMPAAQAPNAAAAPIPVADPPSAPEFICAADVNALRMPALRLLLVAHKLKSVEDASKISDKKVIVKLLVNHLKLPRRRPKAAKLQRDQTFLNVSRGIATVTLLMRAWDPAACGQADAASARAQVIAHARSAFPEWSSLADLQIIGKLCDKSSFFYGRWMLFEVEIRVCTVPFLQWADGNMEPYLRMFPIMMQVLEPHHFALLTLFLILTFKLNRHSSQLIAAVDKPKIERVTLLMLYVMALYANEHADVLATIMTNCVKLVETTIEYHNNRVSNYVPKNVTNLTIENYEFATSICVPVDTLMREMRELFSGAKSVSAQLPPPPFPDT